MDEFTFFETVTLKTDSDNFELSDYVDSDFGCWIEFYKQLNPNDFKSWDNDAFIFDAQRILHNYVIYEKVDASDIDKFVQILEDVKKEDLSELYYFLTKAIELNYFKRIINKEK